MGAGTRRECVDHGNVSLDQYWSPKPELRSRTLSLTWSSKVADHLSAGIGRERPIHRGRDTLGDKADAAVAEEEITAPRMHTPKAADELLAVAVVAVAVVRHDGRRGRPPVHRFVQRVGGQTILRRYRKYRAI